MRFCFQSSSSIETLLIEQIKVKKTKKYKKTKQNTLFSTFSDIFCSLKVGLVLFVFVVECLFFPLRCLLFFHLGAFSSSFSRMFSKFFGGKKEPGPPPPSLEDAQKSIEGRAAALDEKIRHLDKELSGYKQQMAKMRPGAAKEQLKRKAILVLKRKKQYESQVWGKKKRKVVGFFFELVSPFQRDQLASQAFNIDQTAFATQSLQDTASTIAAMKAASGTLKTQLSAVNVDDVYSMTDDMQELLDQNNDIQEALSRTYETPEVIINHICKGSLNYGWCGQKGLVFGLLTRNTRPFSFPSSI